MNDLRDKLSFSPIKPVLEEIVHTLIDGKPPCGFSTESAGNLAVESYLGFGMEYKQDHLSGLLERSKEANKKVAKNHDHLEIRGIIKRQGK